MTKSLSCLEEGLPEGHESHLTGHKEDLGDDMLSLLMVVMDSQRTCTCQNTKLHKKDQRRFHIKKTVNVVGCIRTWHKTYKAKP